MYAIDSPVYATSAVSHIIFLTYCIFIESSIFLFYVRFFLLPLPPQKHILFGFLVLGDFPLAFFIFITSLN